MNTRIRPSPDILLTSVILLVVGLLSICIGNEKKNQVPMSDLVAKEVGWFKVLRAQPVLSSNGEYTGIIRLSLSRPDESPQLVQFSTSSFDLLAYTGAMKGSVDWENEEVLLSMVGGNGYGRPVPLDFVTDHRRSTNAVSAK